MLMTPNESELELYLSLPIGYRHQSNLPLNRLRLMSISAILSFSKYVGGLQQLDTGEANISTEGLTSTDHNF